jgi:hypothetical protein
VGGDDDAETSGPVAWGGRTLIPPSGERRAEIPGNECEEDGFGSGQEGS